MNKDDFEKLTDKQLDELYTLKFKRQGYHLSRKGYINSIISIHDQYPFTEECKNYYYACLIANNTNLVEAIAYRSKKTLFKFRQFELAKWCDLFLFQGGRWTIGITLDVEQDVATKKLFWSTWLLSIDLIFIHFEFHKPYDDEPRVTKDRR